MLSHPQGFTATFGLRFDEAGNGVRIVDLARAQTPTRFALVAFYSSVCLLANHTGHRPQVLTDWENEIERVLPGIFAEALAAAA